MAEEKVRNNGKEQEFNFQEWVEQKRARRTALYNKVDEMADKALSDKGVLFDYLTVQAKLGKISVANSLLIAAQNPKATNLRSFEEWKQRGRSVNSGEKGIDILAPDGEYERSDGTIGMNFEAKKVFDVSQTSGGKVFQRKNPPVKNALKALMTNAPVHIKLDDTIAKNIGALYSEDKKVICVARGLESEKPNKDSRSLHIFLSLGVIPVIWAALMVAPFLSEGLMGIFNGFTKGMNNPLSIQWCEDSPKTILIFLLIQMRSRSWSF